MVQCEACGKQIDLPFRCSYCGELLCAEHRLPESHGCLRLPKEAPEYVRERIPKQRKTNHKENRKHYQPLKSDDEFVSQGPLHFEKGPAWGKKHRKKTRKRSITAVFLLTAIILVTLVVILENPNILTQNNASLGNTNAPASSIPSFTIKPQATPVNTDSYADLVNYALSLINYDRKSKGLQDVSISSVSSGQQHADGMLKSNYFSHWDTNGYKPYERYTLAGGQGAVAENIAWQGETGNVFGIDVKLALKNMEHSMMYDDAAWNWGHRDNIINPLHNKVSIGIAYDNHNVYFVEDFEDDYVQWSLLSSSGSQIEMQGTTTKAGLTISQVGIFYDPVSDLNVQQLSNSPYDGSYDSGTYVGHVLAPPPTGSYYNPPDEGILIEATSWAQTGQSFDIAFDLSSAFAQSGTGVYTLYLWTDSNTYLTTYSIWNSG